MKKFWCGVVSLEHIKRGVAGGFCQVCHGKKSPLAKMSVGDGIVFYSPVLEFRGREKCQRFTAIGRVAGEDTYQFQMTTDFIPYRRDIEFMDCREAPIHPLLNELEFTAGRNNWGYKFRFGHFQLSQNDFLTIGAQMVSSSALLKTFNLFSTVDPIVHAQGEFWNDVLAKNLD